MTHDHLALAARRRAGNHSIEAIEGEESVERLVLRDTKSGEESALKFAAGDVRRKAFRQMVTAATDGTIAANSVDRYLEESGES